MRVIQVPAPQHNRSIVAYLCTSVSAILLFVAMCGADWHHMKLSFPVGNCDFDITTIHIENNLRHETLTVCANHNVDGFFTSEVCENVHVTFSQCHDKTTDMPMVMYFMSRQMFTDWACLSHSNFVSAFGCLVAAGCGTVLSIFLGCYREQLHGIFVLFSSALTTTSLVLFTNGQNFNNQNDEKHLTSGLGPCGNGQYDAGYGAGIYLCSVSLVLSVFSAFLTLSLFCCSPQRDNQMEKPLNATSNEVPASNVESAVAENESSHLLVN